MLPVMSYRFEWVSCHTHTPTHPHTYTDCFMLVHELSLLFILSNSVVYINSVRGFYRGGACSHMNQLVFEQVLLSAGKCKLDL